MANEIGVVAGLGQGGFGLPGGPRLARIGQDEELIAYAVDIRAVARFQTTRELDAAIQHRRINLLHAAGQ